MDRVVGYNQVKERLLHVHMVRGALELVEHLKRTFILIFIHATCIHVLVTT